MKLDMESVITDENIHSFLDDQVGGSHYKNMAIQPVEYIHANNIGFIEGNIIKYVSRWRDKGGIYDLQKAIHLTQLLIEFENRNTDA
jgi:hypothetical protein|tara:strand:+ start:304 stop:564 length:261 start_codon:yes stop_codon:yes gene_type:complete